MTLGILTAPRTERPRAPGDAFWALSAPDLYTRVGSRPDGLAAAEARERLHLHGPNALKGNAGRSRLAVLGAQLRNPLLGLLVFAAVASFATGAWTDAVIVLGIVLISTGIGTVREYRAELSAQALRARMRTESRVLRDGVELLVPSEELVPGDVVLLSAGSLVPADGVVLAAVDCYVSEAALTGESFPVEKRATPTPAGTPLAARTNALYVGSNVRSGSARMLVVHTGRRTEFGAIAQRLKLRPPETEFDRGVRHFGYLLSIVMLVMVLVVFAAHVLEGRPPMETLLFAIALAVGLSPELLPAVLSVSLSRGATAMARRGVLVRRLNAIENLGSMDVLCTDKTGTLTEGVVRLERAVDPSGAESDAVLRLAQLNAALESGLHNPLDDAILARGEPDLASVEKLAEVPFDFVRKRVSVVVREGDAVRLVTKGAVEPVLAACTTDAHGLPLDEAALAEARAFVQREAERGVRVMAVATRILPAREGYGRSDETELALAGFLTFLDRPKPFVAEALSALHALGVRVKVITGDARPVAEHVARLVGLEVRRVLTGRDLDELHDEALWTLAEQADVFAEVDPNQKERIILALKRTGHVVGFMGDGVNDAPAMHAADTSISVDSAVDVAREAADFVLLERDLAVVRAGIEEGRRTFANTLKYVLTTTSANLGNMVSMAVCSLVLPFLPLTAGQILLNNFLSDVPAVGIADDGVDPELVAEPRRWSMGFIGRFMVEFGLLSSLFDLLTFALLLFGFRASVVEFRSGWFVESLLTELVIALVVRTRRPCYRSRPGRLLWLSSLLLVPFTIAIPYLPFAAFLGFEPLPLGMLAALLGVTMLYVAAAELLKRFFYR